MNVHVPDTGGQFSGLSEVPVLDRRLMALPIFWDVQNHLRLHELYYCEFWSHASLAPGPESGACIRRISNTKDWLPFHIAAVPSLSAVSCGPLKVEARTRKTPLQWAW